MDIENLIEQLNDWNEKYISNLCGDRTIKCEEYCIKDDCLIVKAASDLSTLQDENESLKEKLYDGEGVNLVDYWMQQAKIEENGHRNCQAENEKLRNEVERQRRSADDRKHLYENAERAYMKVVAELEQVKRENDALWIYIEIVDREYQRYMDRGYIDRLDELKRTWRRGQKED